MKTLTICFIALFAVAAARSVIDDVDGNEPNFHSEIDDRIYGGQETTIEQHPHQVILKDPIFPTCGGSIISPIRALTAAHCFFGDPPAGRFLIQAGSTSHRGDANNQTRQLTRYVIHERFYTPFLSNNIAILFWEEALVFGANVQAIQLPAADAQVPYGQNAKLSGWGWAGKAGNGNLREVTLPLISNEACNRTLTEWIQPDMLCSGGIVGRGACSRDDGGPLVHKSKLIGIFSWNLNRCGKGDPDVYTRVAFFIDWINQSSK